MNIKVLNWIFKSKGVTIWITIETETEEQTHCDTTVSAARCNAQYCLKTTRLKTFGSYLVLIRAFWMIFFSDFLDEQNG